jgi:hypothetical protein
VSFEPLIPVGSIVLVRPVGEIGFTKFGVVEALLPGSHEPYVIKVAGSDRVRRFTERDVIETAYEPIARGTS